MKILLVEADYKNNYPPLGLMKLSNYHKNKGDYVCFVKGKDLEDIIWDRIYITTLFTFNYELTIETIKFYFDKVDNLKDIYVGGISASIMTQRFEKELKGVSIIPGILSNSSIIGYSDEVNIDEMFLDYDILDDINYVYKESNNYFAYLTRGCINQCEFCSVPQIEGYLKCTNNIKNQIKSVREEFGDKRELVLLDNNILGLNEKILKSVVDDLIELGYTKNKTYQKDNPFELLLKKYERRYNQGLKTEKITMDIMIYLEKLSCKRMAKTNKDKLAKVIDYILKKEKPLMETIYEHLEPLLEVSRFYYDKKKYQRIIDFNQGLDARELTKEKMAILSTLPITPFRVAFDILAVKETYKKAICLASSHSVKKFSTYLLYNYNDKPVELYKRLEININLAKELGVSIYSFPMLYAPTNQIKRDHVGRYWNKHYLKNIRSILNVTKGIVAKEEDFFRKAFGNDVEAYFTILALPREFIVYRFYFEDVGLKSMWEAKYKRLKTSGKESILLSYLSKDIKNIDDREIESILVYYKLRYKSLVKHFGRRKINTYEISAYIEEISNK